MATAVERRPNLSINNLSVPRISLNSHRMFTNENKKTILKQSVNIKIESLFFNLHDVMKTVVVAKIIHKARILTPPTVFITS